MEPVFLIILGIVIVWTLVWKAIALWKAGKNGQLAWFVWLFILNTGGILPILYIAFYQKESKEAKFYKRMQKKTI